MSAELKLTDEEVIRVAMRLLGQRTSKRKAKASRENGKLGGRPSIRKKYSKSSCAPKPSD